MKKIFIYFLLTMVYAIKPITIINASIYTKIACTANSINSHTIRNGFIIIIFNVLWGFRSSLETDA